MSSTANVYLKTALILHTLETSQSKGLSIQISAPTVLQYTTGEDGLQRPLKIGLGLIRLLSLRPLLTEVTLVSRM